MTFGCPLFTNLVSDLHYTRSCWQLLLSGCVGQFRQFSPLEVFVLLKSSVDLFFSCLHTLFSPEVMLLVSFYCHSSQEIFFRLCQFYRQLNNLNMFLWLCI